MGPGAKSSQLWWTSTDADEKMDVIMIRTTTGLHKLTFKKEFKILGYTLHSVQTDTGQLGGEDAECEQGLVERRENLRKQRRTMGTEMQENGGTSLQCILFRERKRVLGWETKKSCETSFRFKREEDETLTRCCTRTARAARTIWKKMKLPFLSEMIPESRWRAMGWT